MNIKSRTIFRAAGVVALAIAVLLMSAPLAWAGPAADGTLPTAVPTATPPPTVPTATPSGGPGLRWSFTTNAANCAPTCVITELDPSAVPPAPRNVTFASAATLSGFRSGVLRFTVRVCYQTTDKKDRIYYYDTKHNRWIKLRTTFRTGTQICTNVRFGNVSFAAGHSPSENESR